VVSTRFAEPVPSCSTTASTLTPSLVRILRSEMAGAALSSLNRWKGRRRAAFWRTLRFPNLVLSRAAKVRKREERLKRERLERARALNPFAIQGDCDYLLEPNSRRPRRRG
jgi:hypothetical protein